jgi:pimeloyl-ACP methyl ester carboxylesterase
MTTFFNHQGQRIAYQTWGDPTLPPLLMVHGWISHKGIWDTTAAHLSTRYHCVALDLLGHGDSDKPVDGDHSVAANAARVLALADHLGWTRFNLIGHSMGGMIALLLASRLAVTRIDKLVNVSGVVTGRLTPYVLRYVAPLFHMGRFFPATYAISGALLHFPPYKTMIDRATWHDPRRAAPPTHSDYQMVLIQGVHVAFSQELHEIAALDLRPNLAAICAPVLTIFGRQDNTVPPSEGEVAAAAIADHRLHWLADCGHVPMREQLDGYRAALDGFL